MANDDPNTTSGPAWRRIVWFVALWGLGVVTIAVVGYVLRYVFFAA